MEKTEEPTPKRLADARRRGDVPKSRDLGTFATWLAAVLGLLGLGSAMLTRFAQHLRLTLARIAEDAPFTPGRVASEAFELLMAVTAPFLLAVAGVGTVVAFLQVGPVFAPSKVSLDLTRVNPLSGVRQLFTRDRFVDVLKALGVLGLVGFVLASRIAEAVPSLAALPGQGATHILGVTTELVLGLAWRVAAVLACVAVLDVFLVRHRHRVQLRMSKDEVKREHKDAEGDGSVKGERARLHREILEHTTVESVRTADVLVVNPTHLAIALRFDEEGELDAPEIVAKGEDHLARRMIDAAREAGVPVVRDVPLARALYALELGTEIPEPLYEAVAAVLHAAWAERDAS